MIVRILCEDFRKDQYILQPVIQAMLKALGRPRAKVEMIRDPLLGSVDAALDWWKLEPILDRYRGMTDLFILVVDRDANPNRIQALRGLEDNARLRAGCSLLGENAWQEIEVWALAGQQDLPAKWNWNAIRSDQHPKETYFEPWVRERKLEDSPGEGRLKLGDEAARRYPRVKQLCPEDVASLEDRVKAHLVPA